MNKNLKRILLSMMLLVALSCVTPKVHAATNYQPPTEVGPIQNLKINNTIHDSLSSLDDIKVYKLVLDKNAYFSIDFEAYETHWGYGVYLFKEGDLTPIYSSETQSESVNIPYMSLGKGTYYLEITDLGNIYYNNIDTPYQISCNVNYNNNLETEYNNKEFNANTLPINGTISGSMYSHKDVDYYKLVMKNDGYVTLNITSDEEPYWGYGIYLYQKGSTKKLFTSEVQKLSNIKCNKLYLAKGTYYLKVCDLGNIYYNNVGFLYHIKTNVSYVNKVTFNANGGSVSTSSVRVTSNSALNTLPTPKRKGYSFTGWYTAKNGGTLIRKTTIIKNDQTVYAHWKKISVASVKNLKLSTSKSSNITVRYNKVNNIDGFQIKYSTNKNFSKNTKTVYTKKNTYKLNKLKKNTKYYVQVSAYKIDSCGNKVYGKSVKSSIKVK